MQRPARNFKQVSMDFVPESIYEAIIKLPAGVIEIETRSASDCNAIMLKLRKWASENQLNKRLVSNRAQDYLKMWIWWVEK